VGIDILERGGGQAVDELVVELPDDELVDILVREIRQVDGVGVEEIRPLAGGRHHDPALDALEAVAQLVGATDVVELLDGLVLQAARVIGASWAAVIDNEAFGPEVVARFGDAPSGAWLQAFVAGSMQATSPAALETGDVAWSPLPASHLALILGREGTIFRTRERHEVAAFARVADTRHRELSRTASRQRHPSMG
jgi:hypothetical protein